jgi:branched-chain amino acid transport system substrate-binding protein
MRDGMSWKRRNSWSADLWSADFQSAIFCRLEVGAPTLILLLLLITLPLNAEVPKLKVGVVLGLSGSANTWGEASLKGLKLAEKEINEDAQNTAPKIELVIEDSKTDPTTGITAFNKLVSVNKTPVIIGDVWGFLTNALVPVAVRTKTILASPTVFKESVEFKNNEFLKYFFSMGEDTSSLLPALNNFYKNNPQIKNIAIFCWEDPWGLSYLKVWKQSAKENNINIVEEICSLDTNSDFRTDVLKIRNKKVDLIFATYKTGTILRRLKEQKTNIPIISSSDVIEELINKDYPKDFFNGHYLLDWQPNQTFIDKFQKMHGEKPINQAHNSYELLHSIYKAYLKEPSNIAKGLKTISYEGVAGKIDFTNDNWGNKGLASIFSINNRGLSPVN